MTKGKLASVRLTLLSGARNLTAKQEHQLVALADRTRKMEKELARQRDREERLRTLVTAEGPDLSCGGLSTAAEGCYAGSLAHRVLLILDEEPKREVPKP